jgi:hypothetical protein
MLGEHAHVLEIELTKKGLSERRRKRQETKNLFRVDVRRGWTKTL